MAELQHPLVSAESLSAELASSTPPLLIDGRPAEQFIRGLIAGAVNLDLWGLSLIDTNEAPLRAFMWMIGHLFSLRGVSPDRAVVVYEEDSGIRAARAFWFLEYLGHPNVRVLDGGLRAWRAASLPLTTEANAPKPGPWHGAAIPERVATWKSVAVRIGAPDAVIVDTRSDDEYTGRVARAKHAGAIPGAVHLEWTQNLEGDGKFKTPAELAAMYAAVGVQPGQTIVPYCQGGYRAAHTYLALRAAGFSDVRPYLGSWKEWGDRDDLPIELPNR